MLFGFVISRSISNLLGALYPAYKSFKALDSSDENDDTQWVSLYCDCICELRRSSFQLTYWSVYAFVVWIKELLQFDN